MPWGPPQVHPGYHRKKRCVDEGVELMGPVGLGVAGVQVANGNDKEAKRAAKTGGTRTGGTRTRTGTRTARWTSWVSCRRCCGQRARCSVDQER